MMIVPPKKIYAAFALSKTAIWRTQSRESCVADGASTYQMQRLIGKLRPKP